MVKALLDANRTIKEQCANLSGILCLSLPKKINVLEIKYWNSECIKF